MIIGFRGRRKEKRDGEVELELEVVERIYEVVARKGRDSCPPSHLNPILLLFSS